MSSSASSKSVQQQRRISVSNLCHICCHESDLFCIGHCDHPICFECGVRMRVVCESGDCPICRETIKTMLVVAVAKLSPYSKYTERPNRLVLDARLEKKYGLKFENSEALNAVTDILAHVCTVCEKEPEFATFSELSQHMRRSHELYYCDLCVSNLQLFSWERKCYSREQLAKHRRIGDPDDRSHRGHPLCEFCDERYMDEEHLFKHLRRDHYFCHFCDADGMNKFYPSSDELKKHMKSNHFLCEEGQCKNEPFGIAFRNDIDFKAHKATVHRDKNERLVNIDFGPPRRNITTAADRGGDRGGRNDRGGGGQRRGDRAPAEQQESAGAGSKAPGNRGKRNDPRRGGRGTDDAANSNGPATTAMESFDLNTAEFPSLKPAPKQQQQSSRAVSSADGLSMANRVSNVAGKSYAPISALARSGSFGEHDFPSLSSPANNGGGRRTRKNSRSSSPTKKNSAAPARTFVMIDDDESFQSVSEQQLKKKAEAEAAAKSSKKVSKNKETPAAATTSRQEQINAAWALKSSSSSAWQSKEEAFPSLRQSTTTADGGRQKKSDLLTKPWSQLILHEDQGSSRNGATSTMKSKEKSSSSTTKGAAQKQKKSKVTSPSSMATDALLEALPAGLPVKSKARKVAQQKQRPSEGGNEDDYDQVQEQHGRIDDSDDIGVTMVSLQPPPGFASKNVPPPPPGFPGSTAHDEDGEKRESSVLQNGTTIDATNKPSSSIDDYSSPSYTKPTDFDLRNRALFDRLCASMGHDDASVQAFKKSSSEYRRGELDAGTYCKRVLSLLSKEDSNGGHVFSELVCLLPDIERQNALWNSYTAEIGGSGGANGANSIVSRCPKCGQLLVKMDYYEHVNTAHHVIGGGRAANRRPTKQHQQLHEEYPPLR